MLEQGLFDPARLVFVDETATSTNMARPHGRCARGVRLIGHVPQSHWQTITFVAGLRHDAMVAPMVVEGPIAALGQQALGSVQLAGAFENVAPRLGVERCAGREEAGQWQKDEIS
jgi:hypothetical protein